MPVASVLPGPRSSRSHTTSLSQHQSQQLQPLQPQRQQQPQHPQASLHPPPPPPVMGDRTRRFEGLPARSSPRQHPSSNLATLQALEHYAEHEISRLPLNAPERTSAYRHLFASLIAILPAHGPLLAEVKRHYEFVLDAAAAANSNGFHSPGRAPASYEQAEKDSYAGSGVPSPPSLASLRSSPLPPLASRPEEGGAGSPALRLVHPLQYPASYYEAKWQAAESESAKRGRELQLQRDEMRENEKKIADMKKIASGLSQSCLAARLMSEELNETAAGLAAKTYAGYDEPPENERLFKKMLWELNEKAKQNEKELQVLVKMLKQQEEQLNNAGKILGGDPGDDGMPWQALRETSL